MDDTLLPGLPIELIRAAYAAAPGNEIGSGKFSSPESSAALVANTFGFFLGRDSSLPPIPHGEDLGWPASLVTLETIVRFPWRGGRHPCLDVLVTTQTCLVGIESKRFEPFRPKIQEPLSDAYWRPVWGAAMKGFERVRNGIRDQTLVFSRLDAAQLLKHAFGLRTQAARLHENAMRPNENAMRPILFYLYAEPQRWPDQRIISDAARHEHRAEISRFADLVAGDEVTFRSCSYRELLVGWLASPCAKIRAHSEAVSGRFAI